MNQFNNGSLILSLSALVIAVLSATGIAEANATERRSQAAAQFAKGKVEGFELQRKDFRFFGFTAWLKRGGEWHIEGPVRHRGMLCGTYEAGMRFGIGKPDCTDVQWVSGVRYVTSQYQCNNAEMTHSGTEIDESLIGPFDAITCAEQVIRCTGNCK
ncbi:hypothetical protein [Nitrosospira sp. Nsp13]|uniref:hypothetical protein n=1 Tax=Nitrosospira sp. Nsp13 TaxID=1855332 RepID=UPI000B8A289D|nr:hypothetical protein [Nitrosospira sp. Nsp13]